MTMKLPFKPSRCYSHFLYMQYLRFTHFLLHFWQQWLNETPVNAAASWIEAKRQQQLSHKSSECPLRLHAISSQLSKEKSIYLLQWTITDASFYNLPLPILCVLLLVAREQYSCSELSSNGIWLVGNGTLLQTVLDSLVTGLSLAVTGDCQS